MKKCSSIKKMAMGLCCAVLVVGTLSGCNGTKTNENTSSENTSSAGNESSSESTTEKESKKADATGKEVVITVGDFFANPDKDPERYAKQMEIKKSFEESHPGVIVEDAKWGFDVQSFMAKAEGNTLPTTYYVPLTETRNIMELGYAADLTKEYKERGLYENTTDFILENISKDGKIYFLPSELNDMGLFVNLDLYAQAGYVEEDGTPYQPKTWEEMAEIAVKIKEKTGKTGFIFPTTNNYGGWRFMPIAWSYGVVFEKEQAGKWVASFDSPEAVKALSFIKDLKWKYDVLPNNTLVDGNEVITQMSTEQCAMTISESSQANYMVRSGLSPEKVGMLQLPAGPAKHISLVSGGLRIVDRNSTPEQIKAACDWWEYNGVSCNLTDEIKANLLKKVETDKSSNSAVIGLENPSPWKSNSPLVEYRKKLYEEYGNVNLNHIKLYNKKDLQLQTEEPIDAQALYAVLDSCIQEVLTNPNADPETLLKNAASDFQKNNLDYAK